MYQLAVVGNPIEHSRSPVIWHEFARQTGVELNYTKICAPIDDFEHLVTNFFQNGGLALNITAPFKARAYAMANLHHHAALIAKSANLLINRDNLIGADNTDGVGLVADLTRLGIDLAGKNLLIIGSGSVIYSVLDSLEQPAPARIDLLVRDQNKLDGFVQASRLIDAYSSDVVYDVVINTTPNTLDNQLFEQVKRLSDDSLAYDMIYSAEQTLFMQQMQHLNPQVRSANGIGMLIQQAAFGFERVFSIMPKTEALYTILQGSLNG
jgi:shikimate dehydrogenase